MARAEPRVGRQRADTAHAVAALLGDSTGSAPELRRDEGGRVPDVRRAPPWRGQRDVVLCEVADVAGGASSSSGPGFVAGGPKTPKPHAY